MLAQISGKVRYIDLIDNKSLEETVDEVTLLTRKVVSQSATQSLKLVLKLGPDGTSTTYQLVLLLTLMKAAKLYVVMLFLSFRS